MNSADSECPYAGIFHYNLISREQGMLALIENGLSLPWFSINQRF
jgi:hypothetical protein